MNIFKRCRYGMMIYNRSDIWQGRSFEVYGEYSESEVALFREVIKPGNTIFDVGANIGSHTLPFSKIVGPTGLVVAFEPERNAFHILCGNCAINDLRNVFCYQQAVSSTQGILRVPELDMERTVNFGGLELDKDYSKSPHYVVPMTRLDDVTTPRCDFIKVDVEGMELSVLQGAIETIKKWQPILYVECDRKDKATPLVHHIWSLGYEIRSHAAPFFNPDNFFGEQENVFGNIMSINLLCWPKKQSCPVDADKFKLQAVVSSAEQPVPTQEISPDETESSTDTTAASTPTPNANHEVMQS